MPYPPSNDQNLNPNDHITALSLLKKDQIPYYAYIAIASHPVKLVVKHLPSDLDKVDIKSDLQAQGVVVSNISNLHM